MRFVVAWSTAASLALAALGSPFVTGCTLLVSFDDQPSCDGGSCVDASESFDAALLADVEASRADANAPGDGADDGRSRDAGADVKYAPCEGLFTGYYCGTDHLKGYAGPPTDLVYCSDASIGKVVPCGDAGCIPMTDPFPDTCSQCPSKPAGTYCGRDFTGFPHGDGGDDDILIGCQSGNVSENYPCPHGCKSSGSAASCLP